MMNVKRPAVIDIGSNSVRLVIYEDFSPATSIFYNEKFSCKLGLLTKDGYLMDKAKLKTLQALQRFTKICQANNVISIKAIATAAMRDALDGQDFVTLLSQTTGLKIDIISGSEEAYYAAIGVSYKMPMAVGYVGDLGGGSLELSSLNTGIVDDTRISLPLGVLRLQNDVCEDFNLKKYEKHIEDILSDIDFPNHGHHNFYCVGGSWRALMSFYMQVYDIKLHILQGFTVSADAIKKFIIAILNHDIKISDYDVSHLSKRRLSSIPTAGLLLLKLIEKFKFDTIITSVAGLREGVLINMLPFKRDYESSALAFAVSEADMRSRNPLLYPHFITLVQQIIPDLPERFLLLTQIIIYLSDIAYRRHVDFRAEYIFDFVLFSNLDDLTHQERIIVATSVAWRYDTDFNIPKQFLSYVKHETDMLSWGRSVALILRYLYSITGISHLVAGDLKFIRHHDSLEQISLSNHTHTTVPEGETSQKRLNHLLEHLFE